MENTQLNDTINYNKLQNEINRLNNKVDIILNIINNNEEDILTERIKETKKCNTYIKIIIVCSLIMLWCFVVVLLQKNI